MGPRHDVRIEEVDGSRRCIEDPLVTAGLVKCSTCGNLPDWRFCAQTVLEKDYRYKELKTFLQRFSKLKNKPIKLYYLLDDCLCCT